MKKLKCCKIFSSSIKLSTSSRSVLKSLVNNNNNFYLNYYNKFFHTTIINLSVTDSTNANPSDNNSSSSTASNNNIATNNNTLNSEIMNSTTNTTNSSNNEKKEEEVKEQQEKKNKEDKKEDKKKKATYSSYFKKWITYGLLTATAITIVNYQEIFSERNAIEKLKQGFQEDINTVQEQNGLKYIDRSDELGRIKSYIPRSDSCFVVVIGKKGSGKTILSKQLAKDLKQQVIYIDFHKDMKEKQIIETIAKAINYHPYMNRNDLPFPKYVTSSLLEIVRPSKPTFSEMTQVIKRIGEKFKEQQERKEEGNNVIMPLLIFDNIDALQSREFNFLLDLVELANIAAIKRWFGTVMFGTEEAYQQLKNTSGHSGITSTLFVNGITKEEGIQFIRENINHTINTNTKNDNSSLTTRTIDNETVSLLIDKVCGDHLQTLNDVVSKLKQNKSIEAIIQEGMNETKTNLRGYEFGQISNFPEVFAVWNLLSYMLKLNGECSKSEAYYCIGKVYHEPNVLINNLIQRDLISYTGKDTIGFYNGSVRTLVERIKQKHVKTFEEFEQYQPKERINDFE
ncbi:hypothetical protein ABK040_006937 [Willaertia magna]